MAPGPIQIAIIILVVLLIFGASRVPMIAENLAKGINSFKKGLKDEGESAPSEPKKVAAKTEAKTKTQSKTKTKAKSDS